MPAMFCRFRQALLVATNTSHVSSPGSPFAPIFRQLWRDAPVYGLSRSCCTSKQTSPMDSATAAA